MEKQQIRAALREIDAERKNLDKREKALNDLLATFEDKKVASTRRRVPGKVRDAQVLDLLRSDPDTEFDARRVSDSVPMPYTTAMRTMSRLAEQKQVTVTKPSPGGRIAPTIKHKPVRVVAGSKAA